MMARPGATQLLSSHLCFRVSNSFLEHEILQKRSGPGNTGMLARPGATHIRIAAVGVNFEIHSLALIFVIIGLGQGKLGLKSGKRSILQTML